MHPLMELCPDEDPELPLLVKGGNGIVTLFCPCIWLIVFIVILVVGRDVETDVATVAEVLEPAILIIWGAWCSPV